MLLCIASFEGICHIDKILISYKLIYDFTKKKPIFKGEKFAFVYSVELNPQLTIYIYICLTKSKNGVGLVLISDTFDAIYLYVKL